MAPLPSPNNLDSSKWNVTVVSRENIALGNGTAFSLDQEHMLQTLAVTFASLSLSCSVITFYWFLRMRRSYRHDLIMLLIQSDTWKALWLMMYPAVVFVHGPVSNKSAFCQVNGFMFSLGVEASDFAVLMIAVHSLLNIFKRNPSSVTGLYRYRRIAYFFWIAFPVTMASVAFVNDSNAYVESITYCYLPVRPFWYRLALSWIPRYCIFVFIMIIYATIYFYVRFRFHSFQREGHSNQSTTVGGSTSLGTMSDFRRKRRRFSLPTTPKLMLHGLIPGTRSLSLGSKRSKSAGTLEDWKRSSASTVYSNQREGNSTYLPWMSYAPRDSKDSSGSQSQIAPPNTESTQSFRSLAEQEAGTSTNETLPTVPRPTLPRRGTSDRLSISYDLVIGQPLPSISPSSRSRSFFTMIAALRTHPTDMTVSDSTPVSQLELVDSNGDNIALNTIMATREKIRRQLRLLFIYPLVYMGMWIVPFIFHVLQFSEHYALHPPFTLTCMVTIILAMQCAVDCLLFCSREKPWKHISSTNGGFLDSFKFWDVLKPNRRGSNLSVTGRAGMTREEMVMHARRAYRRREQELAARTALARENGPGRVERSWWDEGFDGAVPTPTVEEIEEWDPLDQRGVRIPETVLETESNEGVKENEI